MQKKSHTSKFISWTILRLVWLRSTDIPLLLVAVPSLLSKALVGVFHPDVCRLQFLFCVVCGFLRVCLHLLLDVNKLVWRLFKEKNPFDVWKLYGTLLQFSCDICVHGFVWERIRCVLLSSLCHNTCQVLRIVFFPFHSIQFQLQAHSHVVDAIHCPVNVIWYSSSTKTVLMTRSRVSAKIPPCPTWVGKVFQRQLEWISKPRQIYSLNNPGFKQGSSIANCIDSMRVTDKDYPEIQVKNDYSAIMDGK